MQGAQSNKALRPDSNRVRPATAALQPSGMVSRETKAEDAKREERQVQRDESRRRNGE